MTSPEDDGLEEALRRALSAAADGVEPDIDGLDKIRQRIDNRPPRPWLLSVLFGVVDRVQNWTWRGHWAWTARLPKLPVLRGPRSRRDNFPRWGFGSLRFAVVLSGIAVIALVTLGVQPFRHAILQAGTALNAGSGPQQVTAGTEGNGAGPLGTGNGAPTDGPTPGGEPGNTGNNSASSAKSGTAKVHPVSAGQCGPTVSPAATSTQPSLIDARPSASAGAPATEVPGVPASASPTVPTSATPAAQPADASKASTSTCPVASPTKPPASTPAATPAAPPTPALTVASPTPTPTPTYTEPTSWPTPTGYPSPPRYDRPRPSDPPSSSWPPYRGHREAGQGHDEAGQGHDESRQGHFPRRA
ncbi:MAG TPA: hypothetical protein VGG83_13060 [Trebonia sp.]